MNHKAPRQRLSDQRWDYVTRNDREEGTVGHPIGYCGVYRPFTEQQIKEWGISAERLEQDRVTAHKHHTDGHATREDACACYKEYLLDHTLRFSEDKQDPETLQRCHVCRTFTSGGAEVDHSRHWDLCKEHRTREVVAGLFEVGESWGSY